MILPSILTPHPGRGAPPGPDPQRKDFLGYARLSRTPRTDWPPAALRFPGAPPAMLIERLADRVVVRAPGKLNLFLEVLGKRPDGYHEIATLMVAVTLYDTLTLADDPSGGLRLECDRPDLSTGPDNLIHRAAALLRERTGCARGVAAHLAKRIPMAAGLAGGSTDAAATLAGLNLLWGLGLDRPALAALAAELGSDVAFFLEPTGAAWCTGRGEQVEPLSPGQPFHFVIVAPPVGLSTAEVYRAVSVPDAPASGEPIRQAFVGGDVEAVGRRLHNRLQPAAERLCPTIASAYRRLADCRPAGQLMSGSGSSLFALCRDAAEAHRLVAALRSQTPPADPPQKGVDWSIFPVRSCS